MVNGKQNYTIKELKIANFKSYFYYSYKRNKENGKEADLIVGELNRTNENKFALRQRIYTKNPGKLV